MFCPWDYLTRLLITADLKYKIDFQGSRFALSLSYPQAHKLIFLLMIIITMKGNNILTSFYEPIAMLYILCTYLQPCCRAVVIISLWVSTWKNPIRCPRSQTWGKALEPRFIKSHGLLLSLLGRFLWRILWL